MYGQVTGGGYVNRSGNDNGRYDFNNDDDYDKLIGRVKSRDNRPLVVRLEDTLRVEHVLFKTKGYSA